jgi:hypothetical protein
MQQTPNPLAHDPELVPPMLEHSELESMTYMFSLKASIAAKVM